MKMFVYSVFDSCASTYDRPMICGSDGEMMRMFGDIARDKQHPIGQHPEHYTLMRIGTWDNNKGFISGETPESVCNALEMLADVSEIRAVGD